MLELTKDWAGKKKGDKIDIKDQSVIDKGLETGLFKKPTKKVKKDK